MTLIQRRLNVDATSWRCIDVEPTLYKRHVPAGITVKLLLLPSRKGVYSKLPLLPPEKGSLSIA